MDAERDATIIYFPPPDNLTIEQERHWYAELEKHERMVEDIKRILKLGSFAVEKGLE